MEFFHEPQQEGWTSFAAATRMPVMRILTERISGSTLPEVERALKQTLLDFELDPRIKKHRMNRIGKVLSAIAIHFLDSDEAAQAAILDYGMERLRQLSEIEKDPGGRWVRPRRKKTPLGGEGGIQISVTQKPAEDVRGRGKKKNG